MEFLVYRSVARVAPLSAESRSIVATAVRNNARDGLTGFLHHEKGLFVQYLEGPPVPLRCLWDKIAVDTRHDSPIIVGNGLLSHRFFGDWRMGYSHGDVVGFLDFLGEATGKTLLADASVRETIWFLRGACQRLDLGLVR